MLYDLKKSSPAVKITATHKSTAAPQSIVLPASSFPFHNNMIIKSRRLHTARSRFAESVAANRSLPTVPMTPVIHNSGQRKAQVASSSAAPGKTSEINNMKQPSTITSETAHKISRLDSNPSNGTVSKNKIFSGMVNKVAERLAAKTPVR